MSAKLSIFSLTTILILISSPISSQSLQLKILKGSVDTVYTPKHVVVGIDEPGSKIRVNKELVNQYKTGTFGVELTLNEGNNKIQVLSNSKSGREEINLEVFYKVKESSVAISKPLDFKGGMVVTTKEGAYLNYSAGQDRLGGAKINYIDSAISMLVIDSLDRLYKVKLSDSRYAFIPKEFVSVAPLGTSPAFTISSSWSVTPSEKWDIIRVSLNERVPYTATFNPELNTLNVELFGVNFNSNWITQMLDLHSIDYVNFEIQESDHLKIVIKLKESTLWGYKLSYVGRSFEIAIKKRPSLDLENLVFGIDAGHGGSATGAVSVSGYKEKDLNLAMAFMLKEELERAGAKCVMSRVDDSDISMKERRDFYESQGVDFLISIHCNAGGSPLQAGGTSTYYKHIEHRDLSKAILKRLLELDLKNFGLVGNFNFSLNSSTQFPSVLVETLFLSSLPDEEKIVDPNFQREIIKKVFDGLKDYISLQKRLEK